MDEILIVGAGPTGLTAAVELARRGVIPRVIDKKPKASTLSRAVGINSRTMRLLKDSGVTNELINRGIRIKKALFHLIEEPFRELNLHLANEPYNFLLALPQDETERILIEKFDSLGGSVEFGTELTGLNQSANDVHVSLQSETGAESAEYGTVFGADGIWSKVRESIGLEFEGIELEDEWSILDFDSASWPHPDKICLFIYEEGRVCLVVPIGRNRYRGVTDRPNAINGMPSFLEIDEIRREGDFAIWVKQAPTYQKNRVYIGGDAAHSHSPVGGRGMNLGIADACRFAELFVGGDATAYTKNRHEIGKQTISNTERARRLVTSTLPGKFLIIRYLIGSLLRIEGIHKRIVNTVLENQT